MAEHVKLRRIFLSIHFLYNQLEQLSLDNYCLLLIIQLRTSVYRFATLSTSASDLDYLFKFIVYDYYYVR
jgi:hypothetical protein